MGISLTPLSVSIMKSLRYLFFSLLLSVHIPLYAEYSPNLNLNSDIDALIRRLSTRFAVAPPVSLYFQPMSVGDVRKFLKAADSLEKTGTLSGQEAFQVRQLHDLFVMPRRVAGWTNAAQDKSCFANISLLGSLDPRVRDSVSLRSRWQLSPSMSGNIGSLSFYSGLDVWTDWYTDTLFQASDYQPYNGVPYNLYGRADSAHARSSDLPRGGIRYATDRVVLETAIDYLRIGPAVHFPLLLSGNAPPIVYGRGAWDLGPFTYVQMAGQLKSQKDKPKYLYMHRLNISLLKQRLTFGFNEAVVNGSTTDEQDSANALRPQYYGQTRSWEWTYLIPFVPYKFSEHYLGDRDNALMSFDGELRYPKRHRMYFEFLVDDMTSPWTLFSDDWGNKWGITAGCQYFGAFRGKDLTTTIEYSRVQPWVYTHFYGDSHRYTHFDKCLGMPLGPNSDALVIASESQISPKNAIGLTLTATRKSNARGGNVTDVFQDSMDVFDGHVYYSPHPDSPRVKFLGSSVVSSTRLGLTWKFSPFGIFKIDALVEYDFAAGKNGLYGHAFGGLVF
jgi:hypothetical protein